MGSFTGHAVPGTLFVIMGVWWMVTILRRLHQAKTSPRLTFRSRPSTLTIFGNWKFDPESVFAIFGCIVGMMIELRGLYLPIQVKSHNIQHATMYFFFGLAGFIGIAKDRLERHLPFIESLHYVTYIFAFAIEAMLFQFHLYGRNDLDVVVHNLLIQTAWLCAFACLLEMCRPDLVMLSLARAYLTFLQGTWFWQVAFILYNPVPDASPWDPEDHHQLMLVACIYAWHIGVALVMAVILAVVVSVCCSMHTDRICQKEDYALEQVNGYTKLLTDAGDADFLD